MSLIIVATVDFSKHHLNWSKQSICWGLFLAEDKYTSGALVSVSGSLASV